MCISLLRCCGFGKRGNVKRGSKRSQRKTMKQCCGANADERFHIDYINQYGIPQPKQAKVPPKPETIIEPTKEPIETTKTKGNLKH
ncbi:hypothetical protein QE152_g31334 [Popillia japonica]|uniref:Uncharacterized protein n=1 Tax=Popillia japonica TaxID=7064 RepID=A0AAW1JCS0_POPJA